jgi:hypothetical protein
MPFSEATANHAPSTYTSASVQVCRKLWKPSARSLNPSHAFNSLNLLEIVVVSTGPVATPSPCCGSLAGKGRALARLRFGLVYDEPVVLSIVLQRGDPARSCARVHGNEDRLPQLLACAVEQSCKLRIGERPDVDCSVGAVSPARPSNSIVSGFLIKW